MNQIKCPHCGEVFTVNETDYEAIVSQVRTSEFNGEIQRERENFEKEKAAAVKTVKIEQESRFKEELSEKDKEIERLKGQLEVERASKKLEVQTAVQEKDAEIIQLKSEISLQKTNGELREKALAESHSAELKAKDEVIEYYKDLKTRLSTKMVGESLEKHCENEFNRLRPTAFRDAYFEKDNDSSEGTKGDYIYRESRDGVEFISIMFEMKNEMDTTSTKHKNEDFLDKLNKDREKKGCEYAVLVSMLESDNEFYNVGIVDMSHRYEKMYVIRPQFFIQMITLLRNAALNSLEYKKELAEVREQNIDITNFEDEINAFKTGFAKNYRIASDKFKTAIEEIDKSINHLQKIKDNLISSENNLRLANNKAEDLSIKKLTKKSPIMRARFEELKKEENQDG